MLTPEKLADAPEKRTPGASSRARAGDVGRAWQSQWKEESGAHGCGRDEGPWDSKEEDPVSDRSEGLAGAEGSAWHDVSQKSSDKKDSDRVRDKGR